MADASSWPGENTTHTSGTYHDDLCRMNGREELRRIRGKNSRGQRRRSRVLEHHPRSKRQQRDTGQGERAVEQLLDEEEMAEHVVDGREAVLVDRHVAGVTSGGLARGDTHRERVVAVRVHPTRHVPVRQDGRRDGGYASKAATSASPHASARDARVSIR